MRRQHGYPGHFIAASSCLFHLHTSVGAFRVSTVGDYYPQHARGPGDKLGERQQIGYKRYFETMVFLLGDDGEPLFWTELETLAYDDAADAEEGHERTVSKYERLSPEDTAALAAEMKARRDCLEEDSNHA